MPLAGWFLAMPSPAIRPRLHRNLVYTSGRSSDSCHRQRVDARFRSLGTLLVAVAPRFTRERRCLDATTMAPRSSCAVAEHAVNGTTRLHRFYRRLWRKCWPSNTEHDTPNVFQLTGAVLHMAGAPKEHDTPKMAANGTASGAAAS